MYHPGSRWTPGNVAKMVAAVLFGSFLPFYVLIVGLSSKKKKVITEGALYAGAFVFSFPLTVLFPGLSGLLITGTYVASAVRMYQLRNVWLPYPRSNTWGQIAHPPPYSQIGSYRQPGAPAQIPPTSPRGQAQPAHRDAGPPPYHSPLHAPLPYSAPPPTAPPSSTPPSSASSPSSSASSGRNSSGARPSSANPSGHPAQSAQSNLPEDLSGSLDWVSATAKRNKQRLPSEAYISVLEISQELSALLDAESKDPSGDAEFEYELEALAGQYLPAVLKGYIAIPPALVEQVQPNGKTPNAELVEQLELLAGQTSALYSSRYSHTTAELTTTGNFLRERYGHRKSDAFDFGVE